METTTEVPTSQVSASQVSTSQVSTSQVPVFQRELEIAASPETVWAFLADPEKLTRWMGMPATAFDLRPGGAYRLEIANGHVASGTFVEIDPPGRLVYTWGWEATDGVAASVPPGASTVELELEPTEGGTLLRLTHRDLPTPESAESHGGGWTHYLARLVVAAEGGDPGTDPWLQG